MMRDPGSKRSRGFGFITYDDPQCVEDCLASRPHVVDGKEVEAKRAVPREENNPVAHTKTKKIFLGGLAPDTSEEEIRHVLEQHGPVNEVTIMRDKLSNKPRGFGFVVMNDYDVVDKLCIKKFHRIGERDVEFKKAQSQEEIREKERTKGLGGNYRSDRMYDRGGDMSPYGSYSSRSPMGGYGDMSYRGMGSYDYSRYNSEYMRDPYGSSSGAYGMGAYADRSGGYGAAYPAYRGSYDMASYGSMYSGAMNPYAQAASSYGPTKSPYTTAPMRDRGERGGAGGAAAASSRAYHPYRR